MKDIHVPVATTPSRTVLIDDDGPSEITPDGDITAPLPAPAATPPPLVSTAHMHKSPRREEEPATSDDDDDDDEEEPTAAVEPTAAADKNRYVRPAQLDRERKRRRLCTSDVIDSGNINRNVILPLSDLISFLEKNFCCRLCHKSLNERAENQAVRPLQLEIFGLACGLNFQCECGIKTSLRPTVVPEAVAKLKTLKDGHPFATRVNAGGKSNATCKHCGIKGHQRISSLQCLKNPKNLAIGVEKTAVEAAAVGK
jgi:hypothetical protein